MKRDWISRDRRLLRSDGRCGVMAIVNCTPDSFSDGGRFATPESAVAQALGYLDDGADILDIGGESTRPFAQPVDVEEEWSRIGPVLEALIARRPDAVISVDTYKPEIARRSLQLGGAIINDITGCDPAGEMPQVIAEGDAAVVIMHMRGTPATMQVDPEYANVIDETMDFLSDRIRVAEAAGIARRRIAIDPGIGFGKTMAHNLSILRNLFRFHELGCAVLIGTSRKRMIGEITGRDASRRVAGSVSSALHAACHGADIVRVHDVAETVDALKVWQVLESGDVR